ncbi:hypothetical protein CEXT_701851 [Caerostris extrusa]|uniref:Uncharacterized protein n=1 Tax=Caerostris extrusa TaxID=172846 RepID=A0AAV4VJW7_CAEEX|nr:hypothetical protein CEXT_701851 [Caerostris extrusa]
MTRIFLPNQCSPNFVRNPSCSAAQIATAQAQTKPGLSERPPYFSCYSSALNFDEGGDWLMSQPDGRITNLNLGIMEAEDSAAFQRLESSFFPVSPLFSTLPSKRSSRLFNECSHLHAFQSQALV